jgi:hypothetical protein
MYTCLVLQVQGAGVLPDNDLQLVSTLAWYFRYSEQEYFLIMIYN